MHKIKNSLINNKGFYRLYILFYGIKHLMLGIKHTKIQSPESRIYQISHRLERGLCLNNRQYKINWGFNKANELVDLLSEQINIENNDSVRVGTAALGAFIRGKEQNGIPEEAEAIQQLKDHAVKSGIEITGPNEWSGVLKLCKDDILCSNSSELDLFFSRHSCRDFSNEPIDKDIIIKAIELANRAPSSCNRQASVVYVLDAKEREKITGENTMGADKYLIICGIMDSFAVNELNDWIVSTSIYAGFLSMALHAVGIGSCFMRKDIICKSGYNKKVKEICRIPDNHQIIIEMAIGNYSESFFVPLSKRKNATEMLVFCD